jgi:hypothetical protein
MPSFTIELDDLQVKSLSYVAADPNDWIQNAIRERCRLAFEELVADTIQHNLAHDIPITGGKVDIALASTLPSAADRNAAMHAQAMAGVIPGA